MKPVKSKDQRPNLKTKPLLKGGLKTSEIRYRKIEGHNDSFSGFDNIKDQET